MEPGSVTTVPLEYQLPPTMVRPTGPEAYEYRLLLQKQPGMDQDRVSVAVELLVDAELAAAPAGPSARSRSWVAFDFILDYDREVAVDFRVPGWRLMEYQTNSQWLRLFYCDGFGQVARLVYVAAPQHCDLIGQ